MGRVAQRIAELRTEYAEARDVVRAPPGIVHLLGIAGVGVAGVAVQLVDRGFAVTGCDGAPESLGPWLNARGIAVMRGHDPRHLDNGAKWLVRTPAVAEDEPELLAARKKGLPVFYRGTILPALLAGQQSIAVGGTHGKTTTSAMIAHALCETGTDLSFCIGGDVPTLGGVARAGSAGVMVVEADESDGTLALYEADYAVITNVEMDHVDFFEEIADLDFCFSAFAKQARTAVVYCADDAGAVRAANTATAKRISYALSAFADWTAREVCYGPLTVSAKLFFHGQLQGLLRLNVPGRTNLLDAMAAVAVCVDRGSSFADVAAALQKFRSVRRRFDMVAQGREITVISDYAHHPTEIAAFLQQVRGLNPQRVLAVFQAHRYSRTAALGPAFPPAFEGVDELILAPVYAASEEPVPGGMTDDLSRHFERWGKIPVTTAQSLLDAWEIIRKKWRAGDVVLVVGAGDVEQLAFKAAAELGEE